MKQINKNRTKAIALAAIMVGLTGAVLMADETPKLPKNAAEHVARPAYLKAPQPEVNPWAPTPRPPWREKRSNGLRINPSKSAGVRPWTPYGRSAVFWHGVNYIPMMVNENGQWYSNEFNETWWNGGFEPMADKRMVYGRVDIVEQSPARVVVRWRYPLNNVAYQIFAEGWADDSGWGEWSDWIGAPTARSRIFTGIPVWHSSNRDPSRRSSSWKASATI